MNKIEIDITRDRKEIARIIRVNLSLMIRNEKLTQEVADSILLYLIDRKGEPK